MTVHDIIKLAFANEYEDFETDPEASRFSIDVLNMLIADAFEAEQYYREMHGQTPLTAIPSVSDIGDTVSYNDGLTRIAFPYGIEWKFCEQNLEIEKAAEYRALYERARDAHGGRYYRRKV